MSCLVLADGDVPLSRVWPVRLAGVWGTLVAVSREEAEGADVAVVAAPAKAAIARIPRGADRWPLRGGWWEWGPGLH